MINMQATRYERANALYEQYVGAGCLPAVDPAWPVTSATEGVEMAIDQYLIALDSMFGAGAADDAPEDLADMLLVRKRLDMIGCRAQGCPGGCEWEDFCLEVHSK